MEIADAAMAGNAPSRDDLLHLLSFNPRSPEAAYAVVRAREIAEQAGNGAGLVHAQIGVDAKPCPENCRFCAFAASNLDAGAGCFTNESDEVPLERIVEAARNFDEAGVGLISLMATAGLPFERYLEMLRAVREAVSPDMPLLANTADFTLDQAHALKAAGAQAVYHARRIREGSVTDISPDTRLQTIRNAHEAGLALMTGVEPLWEGVDNEEIADRIVEIPGFAPYCVGACTLSAAKGTEMENEKPSSKAKARLVGALVRLAVGYAAPFGGSGGIVWVDAGTDPRARGYGHGREWILSQVGKARRSLQQDEWVVAKRPSLSFFEEWSTR